MDFQFRHESLQTFLNLLASKEPGPAGGSAAAVATALAAGLVAMAARLSTESLVDAPTITADAERLRDLATELANDDAIAYREVMAAYRLPQGVDPDERQRRIRGALTRAADVPMDLAGIATETAVLSVRVLEEGKPSLRGDAFTAALLALAGIRAATTLAEINVALGGLDGDRLARARGYRATATELYRRLGTVDGDPEGP